MEQRNEFLKQMRLTHRESRQEVCSLFPVISSVLIHPHLWLLSRVCTGPAAHLQVIHEEIHFLAS